MFEFLRCKVVTGDSIDFCVGPETLPKNLPQNFIENLPKIFISQYYQKLAPINSYIRGIEIFWGNLLLNQYDPDSTEMVLNFRYSLEDFGEHFEEDFWDSIESPPRNFKVPKLQIK